MKVDPYMVPLLYGALVPHDRQNADQSNSVATLRYDHRKFHVSSFDVHRRRERISESAKTAAALNSYFPHIKVDYSLLRFFKDFDKVDAIVQKAIALEAESDYLFCAVVVASGITPVDEHRHPLNDYGVKTYLFTIDDKTKPWITMAGVRREAEPDEVLVVTMDGQTTMHSLMPEREDEIIFCVLFEEITNTTREVTWTSIKKDRL